MMPRKWSILMEEASGAIKMLKRLERTNPSVGIDGMNDYQQVLSALWDSAPELAGNKTVIQHVFLVVISFLQLDFIIAMIRILICQICSLG